MIYISQFLLWHKSTSGRRQLITSSSRKEETWRNIYDEVIYYWQKDKKLQEICLRNIKIKILVKWHHNELTGQQVDDRLQNVLYYLSWIKVYKIFHLFDRLLIPRSCINMVMVRLAYLRLKLTKVYWTQLRCEVVCPSLGRFDRNLVGLELGLQRKQLLHVEQLGGLSPLSGRKYYKS